MTLIRWEPVRTAPLHTEMNRVLSSFFDTATGPGRGGVARRWAPALDLSETQEHFVLRTDLPGLDREAVTIELEDRVLTISGERRPPEEPEATARRTERAFGPFSRAVTLPEGVDPELVSASFTDGVLEIRIPKPEQRKPHKVAIAVGAEPPKTIEGGEAA
jgi:HSP20 family protein